MALKAGLVGVNPNGVDKNGMPKMGDTYTKLEINQMMASKVPVSQLRANNKDFTFAYDSTSEKYGYKAGADGEFVPFDGAGGGPGWVPPANLITTGLTYTNCEYVSGGYQIIGDLLYVDIIVRRTSSANAYINTLPTLKFTTGEVCAFYKMSSQSDTDTYIMNGSGGFAHSDSDDKVSLISGSSGSYVHGFGIATLA